MRTVPINRLFCLSEVLEKERNIVLSPMKYLILYMISYFYLKAKLKTPTE